MKEQGKIFAAFFLLLLFFTIKAYAIEDEALGSLPAPIVPEELYNEHMNDPNVGAKKLWYRNAGEWISSRTVREGISTEPTTKVITDGKRFDVTLGKRFPLYTWNEKSLSEAWSLGIDAGMYASLTRYNNVGRLTFGTNTFDGFFGADIAYAKSGNIFMLRTAHLSAHQVDNSPNIFNTINYSQFWNQLIIGKEFPAPESVSDFDLYAQGSVGLNNTSIPKAKQPRAALGISLGKALQGPDTLAILASADALRAGVIGQSTTYSYFLGLGYLQRPNNTHRPLRFGVQAMRGSDQRNQYYAQPEKFTAFEIQTEF